MLCGAKAAICATAANDRKVPHCRRSPLDFTLIWRAAAAKVGCELILLKNSSFGKIREIFCPYGATKVSKRGVRPNWSSAAHVPARCASRQISSDFSVSRVLSEKIRNLKFGVFQRNQPILPNFCIAANVGYQDGRAIGAGSSDLSPNLSQTIFDKLATMSRFISVLKIAS